MLCWVFGVVEVGFEGVVEGVEEKMIVVFGVEKERFVVIGEFEFGLVFDEVL